MRDAIIFLMGATPGIIAGYMIRDFKIHFDAVRRERNIMRIMQDRAEKAANQ
jgi:hypothetical protein